MFFPGTSDFEIENVTVADNLQLLLRLRSTTANCPLCAIPAQRVQSRYTRSLADLPISGRGVQLRLLVRRFYCDNSECIRRIFAERFTSFTRPYAQRTNRLEQGLLQFGLTLGGEAGARLAQKLGFYTSPDTLLRLLKTPTVGAIRASAAPIPLTKVGIDDWSWKRGRTFGTIIINLENHKVVDLLKDRTTETVSEWLKQHPHLEVVSRDRSTEYALAITQGAPAATQVADRFHLVRNLAEQVELLLARVRKEWRPTLVLGNQEQPELAEHSAKELPESGSWKALTTKQNERKSQARRAERKDRYEQVVQLRAAGVKYYEIAKRTGLSDRIIGKWLAAGSFPEYQPHPKRHSIFDEYAGFVLKRWQEGMHDGHKLWEEIKAQGFKGSERMVQRFLQQLRDNKGQTIGLPPASPLSGLKAPKAVWWFIRKASKLSEEEAEKLRLMREASVEVNKIYEVVQRFMEMVWQRKGEELEGWIAEVKESLFEELHSFVRGIERDKAAVVAGLSLAYSNGPTEGHNNRLKLIKRSMYGRAKLTLLKQRVLANT
jgi:transposase